MFLMFSSSLLNSLIDELYLDIRDLLVDNLNVLKSIAVLVLKLCVRKGPILSILDNSYIGVNLFKLKK